MGEWEFEAVVVAGIALQVISRASYQFLRTEGYVCLFSLAIICFLLNPVGVSVVAVTTLFLRYTEIVFNIVYNECSIQKDDTQEALTV